MTMDRIEVEIKRLPGSEGLPLPGYMSDGASGMDLPAAVPEPVSIAPGAIELVPTGFAVAVPRGLRGPGAFAQRHGTQARCLRAEQPGHDRLGLPG